MTVIIKPRWLGLKKTADLFCDRCESQLEDGAAVIYRLCETCAGTPPAQARPYTFFYGTTGFDGPYFRTSALHQDEILADCRCAGCDAALGGEQTIHDVCDKCISTHPDMTHTRWHSDSLIPWRDKQRRWQDEFDVRHCLRCSGLQVVFENASHELEFRYYRRGVKQPTEPFACDRQSYQSHWDGVRDCRHEWILVEDRAAQDMREVVRKLRAFFSQPQVGEVDQRKEEQYIRMAHGISYHWCFKCGHFETLCLGLPEISLPPQGESSRQGPVEA